MPATVARALLAAVACAFIAGASAQAKIQCFVPRTESHHGMVLDSCEAYKDLSSCQSLGNGNRIYGADSGRGGWDSIASCCKFLGAATGPNNPMGPVKNAAAVAAAAEKKCNELGVKEYPNTRGSVFKPANPADKVVVVNPACYVPDPKVAKLCIPVSTDFKNEKLCEGAVGNKYGAIYKNFQAGWTSLEECCAGTYKGKADDIKACQEASRKKTPGAIPLYYTAIPPAKYNNYDYAAKAMSMAELSKMATADGIAYVKMGCIGDKKSVSTYDAAGASKLKGC